MTISPAANEAASIGLQSFAIGDTGRTLDVYTVTGARPGPTLSLIGVIHGDELEGVLALTRLLGDIDARELAGRLIVLPVANPDAIAAGTRCSSTDGKNLARVFPGNLAGTPTEIMAALITEHVIAPANALIDLHSAGVALACPFFVGYADNVVAARSRAMAEAFSAEIVWRHANTAPGRTISVAHERGIPAIYAEATGGVVPSAEVVAAYTAGVRFVMRYLGMLPMVAAPMSNARNVHGDGDLDAAVEAPVAGLLRANIDPGDQVAAGQTCFTITGTNGSILAELQAQSAGIAMFVRRARWVEAGQTVMALAVEESQP